MSAIPKIPLRLSRATLIQALQKLVLVVFFGFLYGDIGHRISFDIESYLYYARRISIAELRYTYEPNFPFLLKFFSDLGFVGSELIKAISIVAALVMIYAVIELAAIYKKWSLARAIAAILLCTPILLFALIVLRQGLATGFSLLSIIVLLKSKKDSVYIWAKSLLFTIIAFGFHNAVGAYGFAMAFLIVLSRNIKILDLLRLGPLLIVFVIPIIAYVILLVYVSYGRYAENFRPTGRVRIAGMFLLFAFYLFTMRKEAGDFFGKSNPWNTLNLSALYLMPTLLYFFVSTDSARLIYPVCILMLTSFLNRNWQFLRRDRTLYPLKA